MAARVLCCAVLAPSYLLVHAFRKQTEKKKNQKRPRLITIPYIVSMIPTKRDFIMLMLCK